MKKNIRYKSPCSVHTSSVSSQDVNFFSFCNIFVQIFYIPQTQCGGYNDSYNLIHECNVKVQYLCSVKGIFLILKPICIAVKYLQPSYNCKDLVKRKWFHFYSWLLIIILGIYTGCCKTSAKLWKHITETFYGVFLVFLGFYDCQLWAIFHFGTFYA